MLADVASTEKELLVLALEEHGQNCTSTALGISRVGLYKKMKKHGRIPPQRDPTGPQTSKGGSEVNRLTRTGNAHSEQVADTEQELLVRALEEHGQSRTATAKALGISRVALYQRMKKYGLIGSD